MAWFDIAAGLAQGAQQGIDRVQADMVRRKADAFKDAQEKRALAAEARLVEQDAQRKIAEFINRSDPNNLDPVEVQKFGAAANSYITKATDGSGRLVARVDPLTAIQRTNVMATEADASNDLISKQLNRGLGDLSTKTKTAAMQTYGTPAYDRMNDTTKIQVALAAGKSLEETMTTLKNPDVLRRLQPGVFQAEIAAGAARAGQAADYAAAVLKDNRTTTAERNKAVASFMESIKDFEPAAQDAALANFYKQTSYSPPSASGVGTVPDGYSLLPPRGGK